MEKSVRTMETQRAQQYGGLAEALAESNRTGTQLRETTSALAGALRSSSACGTWGAAPDSLSPTPLDATVKPLTAPEFTQDRALDGPDWSTKKTHGTLLRRERKAP